MLRIGVSKGNAVGIDETPSEMFGKVMSISDELMSNWFELCTDVPMDEVAVLCDGAKSHLGQSKRRLAREIITIYHGQDAAVAAEARFDEQFKQHKVPDDIPTFLVTADLKDGGHTRAVVAVGCLAERYGKDLATSLPEADAVLGFDDYPDIADKRVDPEHRATTLRLVPEGAV